MTKGETELNATVQQLSKALVEQEQTFRTVVFNLLESIQKQSSLQMKNKHYKKTKHTIQGDGTQNELKACTEESGDSQGKNNLSAENDQQAAKTKATTYHRRAHNPCKYF